MKNLVRLFLPELLPYSQVLCPHQSQCKLTPVTSPNSVNQPVNISPNYSVKQLVLPTFRKPGRNHFRKANIRKAETQENLTISEKNHQQSTDFIE